MTQSLLEKLRLEYQPRLPKVLENIETLRPIFGKCKECVVPLEALSNLSKKDPFISFTNQEPKEHRPLRIGVVLSGGQAAGGHNVIAGLYDAQKKLNPDSELFGFLNGPKGITDNKYREITQELLAAYRNLGGFDLIGSGRTKIETPEQFKAAEATVRALRLDGLVIIGGDDSNTNAALLAEYFLVQNCPTAVVGVPKTIDGDLTNSDIEISFGFDSAVKTYSEIIGNIARDALSAKKYYYFIKLMGRSASHIALECAMQTQPNMTLIGEEIALKKDTLTQIVEGISDMICTRSKNGKDYGVILIPEGIIEFIPEINQLIQELNDLLAQGVKDVKNKLTQASEHCFSMLSPEFQSQLLFDRDPHGNVQVSKIETERLLIDLVKKALANRNDYKGKFSAQPIFCGYEGRSCLPSNFDAQYCYALGHVAALLVDLQATGFISCVQNLAAPVEEWQIGGRNLVTMISMEKRQGKIKPVIQKSLVNLKSKQFFAFQKDRQKWAEQDLYRYPGPIQFFGPPELTEAITFTIQLASS